MKNKILKILFIISFLPYFLIILSGILCAFSSISFISTQIYGFDAFLLTILVALYSFTLEIPIIPICIIFQLCYILKTKVKKIKKINTKKYVTICLAIGLPLIIILTICSHKFEVEHFIQKINAKQMIKNSEEKICIDSSTTLFGGIFDIPEYESNHVFIDYDNIEIGFLLHSGYDEFWKVTLVETTKDSYEYKHIVNDYFMQTEIPLSYPGKKLITFNKTNSDNHCTIAMLLIQENGKIYFVDNIKDKDTGSPKFTGLKWSNFFVGENTKFSE